MVTPRQVFGGSGKIGIVLFIIAQGRFSFQHGRAFGGFLLDIEFVAEFPQEKIEMAESLRAFDDLRQGTRTTPLEARHKMSWRLHGRGHSKHSFAKTQPLKFNMSDSA